ncbi:cation:proton antiporter [uncultured Aquimarina sp.]|uniref:cation:proton antiporter domain-containing protein n=1 Tax=uncultured Aquimarina sp. TaxID=575652 RepID=UPI0026035ECD|nr:cation:proton antiporter [uncultured Aquimarina sp.]
MEIFSSYNVIIGISLTIILSFIFNGIAKKTNIPAVLMLIILGVIYQYGIKAIGGEEIDFFPMLEVLGIVGLIMIVLEAALELKLKREKLVPILKSFGIALIGLVASAYVAAVILKALIDGMTWQSALLYATPLSILSSAIIIPSVAGLSEVKKEFHVYESTFSDILGIMMFYFLTGKLNPAEDAGVAGFAFNLILTIIISLIASYGIILIFQKIKSQVKLFLLIAVLLLLYGLGKKMHLSSLIIVLIFGLVIANMKLFFKWKLESLLDFEKAKSIYHELHVITAETAFVVRTLFFVIFGITITLSSLLNLKVTLISILIIISIYIIRYVLLRLFIGKDISPQLFIAPRGLITVLLFYAIPAEAMVPGFEPGILLFVIIGTSLIMTGGMIRDKRIKGAALTPEQVEAAADAEMEFIMNTTTDLSEIEDADNDEEEEILE